MGRARRPLGAAGKSTTSHWPCQKASPLHSWHRPRAAVVPSSVIQDSACNFSSWRLAVPLPARAQSPHHLQARTFLARGLPSTMVPAAGLIEGAGERGRAQRGPSLAGPGSVPTAGWVDCADRSVMTGRWRGQASAERGGNLGVWLVCCLPSGNLSWFTPHDASLRPWRAQPGRRGRARGGSSPHWAAGGWGRPGPRRCPQVLFQPKRPPLGF